MCSSDLSCSFSDLLCPCPCVDFWIASHAEVGRTNDVRGIGCDVEEIDSVISSIMNRIAVGERRQNLYQRKVLVLRKRSLCSDVIIIL